LRSIEDRAQKDLLIEILTSEGHWKEAAALLPESGPRRAELTERLALAMADSEPEHAIRLLFDLANLHARSGTRAGYSQSVRALLGANTIVSNQSGKKEFDSLLQKFKIAHRRKTRLLTGLVENGID
jgi:hypothetical protein